MRKIIFVLAVFAFTASAPVYAANNTSGIWELTMVNPKGEADSFEMVITQGDENLNVSVTNLELQMELSGIGTLKGEKIEFSLKSAKYPQFEWIFKGEVTGKKMEGSRKILNDRGLVLFFLPQSIDGKERTRKETKALMEAIKHDTWSAVME